MTFCELLLKERRRLGAELFVKGFVGRNRGSNRVPVVVIVSQGGVHVTEGDSRVPRSNLIGTHAAAFMPDDDVLHGDPMSRNARLAAADVRRHDDMFRNQ